MSSLREKTTLLPSRASHYFSPQTQRQKGENVMPKDSSADMMQALVAKLYKTITGDNPEIKMPRNKFVTWMLPGLPFIPEDFMYCAKGLIGDSAEATRERYHQAWTLSKLLNYVPDVSNQFLDAEMQQTIFSSTQDTISSVYSDVLKYSKVVDMPLSDKETAKLEKFRNLLTVTKETVDIITDERSRLRNLDLLCWPI